MSSPQRNFSNFSNLMIPSLPFSFLASDIGRKEAKWRSSVRSSITSRRRPSNGPKGDIDTNQLQHEDTLAAGDYVGDEPTFNGTPMDCTVIAKGSVTCFALAQTDLISLLFEDTKTPFEDQSEPEMANFVLASRSFHTGGSFIEKANNKDRSQILWENLSNLGEIGAGTFGKVYLMEDKTDKMKYALKAINLVGSSNGVSKHEGRVKNEIEILTQMNSHYISSLFANAKRKQSYFLLLEFIPGGEFKNIFHPIDKNKKLKQRQIIAEGKLAGMPHQAAKFYIATISLPLVYLHRRGIAYRDLKPENIMIDRFGYPKLVDFGLSKRIDAIGKTFTLCGTTEYMAPEIILGDGHNQAVDWWALGVLLYEMIVGATPFIRKDSPRNRQGKIDIFERIVTSVPLFPTDMEEPCKMLIQSLLNPKPVFRLGCCRRGNKEFEEHDWFRGEVDWVALNIRQMRPPWTPLP